jgi:hypothetical protein
LEKHNKLKLFLKKAAEKMMSGVTVQDNFFPSSSGLIPRNWDN